MIQAVRGLVPADAIGVTLLLDRFQLYDQDRVAAGLKAFAAAGGNTVVVPAPPGAREIVRALPRLAEDSGVQIVAAASQMVGAGTDDPILEVLTDRLLEAVRWGMEATSVRAGVLGEMAVAFPPGPDDILLLRAVARAHRLTGVAVMVRTPDHQAGAHRVLDYLLADGVDLRRTALTGAEGTANHEWHSSLLARGVWLACRPTAQGGGAQAVRRLLEAGWSGQLLMASDDPSRLADLRLLLDAGGVDSAAVDELLTRNPGQFLGG